MIGGTDGSHSDYVEAVLEVVESIPPGRVMTYGMIAEIVRDRFGRGTARTVGTVMSRYGGPVPWHRVVASNGRLPPGCEIEARAELVAEGAPFCGDKVDVRVAAWWPDLA